MTPDELKEKHRLISQTMFGLQTQMNILRAELKPLETKFENAWKEKLRLESQMATITFVKPAAAKAAGSSQAKPMTTEQFVKMVQKLPADQQAVLIQELNRIKGE